MALLHLSLISYLSFVFLCLSLLYPCWWPASIEMIVFLRYSNDFMTVMSFFSLSLITKL